MEKKKNPKEFRDQYADSEQEITDALDRIIERAKDENEALKEMLNKIYESKPGKS